MKCNEQKNAAIFLLKPAC